MRYISINTHQGYEQGRRDDLESLFYIIIYFIKGELPWQNIKGKTKAEKYSKILEIKKKVTENGELVEGLPIEMGKICEYILELNFAEKPNYLMIKNALEMILAKFNLSNDLQFDWYNLEFLNYLYLLQNSKNKENEKKENKKVHFEEKEQMKNIEKSNSVKKLNTINNINGYVSKKLKSSFNKNMININNSYIRNKNNQERSKSLLSRKYAQKITKKNNYEQKKIKAYMEVKERQNKEVLKLKENIKIKNLKIKK